MRNDRWYFLATILKEGSKVTKVSEINLLHTPKSVTEGKDKQSANYTHVKNNNMHILWLAPVC